MGGLPPRGCGTSCGKVTSEPESRPYHAGPVQAVAALRHTTGPTPAAAPDSPVPLLPSSPCHRSPPAVTATPAERSSARVWRLLCLPWLLALVCIVTLQLGAQAAARPAPALDSAALGAGAASLTILDPVDQLAIDLAEHLPAAHTADALPPLPLHAPWATGSLATDDVQGAELPVTLAQTNRLPGARTLPAPLAATQFASSDLRRSKRPPRSPDRPRP